MMMQAGGMSVILGLVEATQRVSFHPGALLWGRSWTSGLFGGYKARSELPKLVERCMKGVSNLFIYAYKFPYITYLSTHDHPPTFCVHLPLHYNSNHIFLHMHHHPCLVKIKSTLKISYCFSHREIIPYLYFGYSYYISHLNFFIIMYNLFHKYNQGCISREQVERKKY